MRSILWGTATVWFGALALAAWQQQPLFLAVPFGLLLVWWTLADLRTVFYLMWATIPLSTEMGLPGGFNTDMPSEPLMWLVTASAVLWALQRPPAQWRMERLVHPLTILLLAHLGWILLTALTAQNKLFAVKFFLAKLWYVIPFYFLAGSLLRQTRHMRWLIWVVGIPLALTILYVEVRHAQYGFSFKDINKVVRPFYRNHVAYACLASVFLPFLWYGRKWYKHLSPKWWLLTLMTLLALAAVQLSYTRAAYGAILVAAIGYLIIRMRLMRLTLTVAVSLTIGTLTWLAHQNKYLDLAPDYERTITHYDFDNLLEATFKGQDISTMERVYRWVAGVHMVLDRPLVGFGPGNFFEHYWPYTVTSFRTYVSDNKDSSGVHSYYLMTAIEQGIPGLLIFLSLLFYALLRGEAIYHETENEEARHLVLIALLSLLVICTLLLINDLIETDKVGPFFFLSLALLVNADLDNRSQQHTASKA